MAASQARGGRNGRGKLGSAKALVGSAIWTRRVGGTACTPDGVPSSPDVLHGTPSMLEWVPSPGSVVGSMVVSSPAPEAGSCTGVLRSQPRTDALMLENCESTMSSAASTLNIIRNGRLAINMQHQPRRGCTGSVWTSSPAGEKRWLADSRIGAAPYGLCATLSHNHRHTTHPQKSCQRLATEALQKSDGPFVTVDQQPARPCDMQKVVRDLGRIWNVEFEAASTRVMTNFRTILGPGNKDG